MANSRPRKGRTRLFRPVGYRFDQVGSSSRRWKQVKSPRVSHVLIQQVTTTKYTHRPIDCVQKLFAAPRPVLWSAVTSVYPHRKYYLNVDSGLGPRRLPQWASMYILFFYFSDLTRYRSLHFDRFLESKYGPQVESILDECPSRILISNGIRASRTRGCTRRPRINPVSPPKPQDYGAMFGRTSMDLAK